MGFFKQKPGRRVRSPTNTVSESAGIRMQMVAENSGIYTWNGMLYQSDIVRSCIRPKAKAIGKMTVKHIREDAFGVKINPEPYMRILLSEPNPYMSGQMLAEKLVTMLLLNGNAFALIVRDGNGCPTELYPVPAVSVEAVYSKSGELYLKFLYANGKAGTFPYSDIIHVRQDYSSRDVFGESPMLSLTPLMSVMSPVALMMVHNVAGRASGDYHSMDKASQLLRTANEALASAYVAKSGKAQAEILAMMDSETWMSAEGAKANELIDKIAFAETMDAEMTNAIPAALSAHGRLSPEAFDRLASLIAQKKRNIRKKSRS